MRFQTRLFIIWGLVVLLIWAGTWWPVRSAIDASFTRLSAEGFAATRRDLHTQEAEHVRSMRQTAAMLMNIPELRALIAEHNFEVSSENLASLQERLDNLADIVGVSFICVLDAGGHVIAQNHASPWKGVDELNTYLKKSPQGHAMVRRIFAPAAASAKATSTNASGIWSREGSLFDVVGIPLVFNSDTDSAPSADGGLIMAVPLTDQLASALAQNHKCEVSFLTGESVVACSLPAVQQQELRAAARHWAAPPAGAFDLALGGVSYRSSIDPMIDPCSNQTVGAMLIQSDLKDARAARSTVSTRLVASMVGGLAAAALASFFVSGAVTRPVRELARGVKRLADCDLDVRINVGGRDELGQLAATFNDMVRQLRVRRELERVVEEARATSKAKSEFLATMSHEIRTPLNGVIGMAELLLRSGLNDRQQRYAGMVKSSAEVLTTLINDILDYSKMEAKKLELESLDFNLHETTEDVVELLATRAMAKGLEVACDIDPAVPQIVCGDATRIRQIIVNLLNNAIKFTDHGQVIVRVSSTSPAGESVLVRIEVIDSGIGIPADRMGRLFQSFSQVDASTTRRFGGTGLGLAICKQLVELMGGQIGVTSEPGNGSTFWFTLSLPASAQPADLNDPAQAAIAGTRLLVVSENSISRDILLRKLTAMQFRVDAVSTVEAANFNLALGQSQHLPYRVVIFDKKIRSAELLERPADIATLWLVPLGNELEPAAGAGNAFSGFITTPVRNRQLLTVLRAALGTGQATAGANGPRPALATISQSKRHRILLAEDNAVNQMIACELLSASGYSCDVVEDGQSAVKAVQSGGYDLVLMDCQMPVMDGFAATAAIRAWERQCPDGATPRHIPIIALTANTGAEDRERCRAANMDGYCSKPFSVDELLSAIRSLLPPGESPKTPGDVSAKGISANVELERPVTPPAFSTDLFLRRCSGNVQLAITVLKKFELQSVEMLGEMRQSLVEGDLQAVARSSHRLRGTAGILAADALEEAAGKLEDLSRAENSTAAADALSQLGNEVQTCIAYIETARTRISQSAAGGPAIAPLL